jgi:hypothetical protein
MTGPAAPGTAGANHSVVGAPAPGRPYRRFATSRVRVRGRVEDEDDRERVLGGGLGAFEDEDERVHVPGGRP